MFLSLLRDSTASLSLALRDCSRRLDDLLDTVRPSARAVGPASRGGMRVCSATRPRWWSWRPWRGLHPLRERGTVFRCALVPGGLLLAARRSWRACAAQLARLDAAEFSGLFQCMVQRSMVALAGEVISFRLAVRRDAPPGCRCNDEPANRPAHACPASRLFPLRAARMQTRATSWRRCPRGTRRWLAHDACIVPSVGRTPAVRAASSPRA
jgi:hypothetical protein